ncbi:DUF3850 domain-containing protein [Amedibacillus sp. YH-ame6]
MNEKLVERFKRGKIVVNCKTENEAKRFIKWCFENGMRWMWDDVTCTHFNDDYNICYGYDSYLKHGNYDYYISQMHTIVSFNEMFNNTFTKDDLKVATSIDLGEVVKNMKTHNVKTVQPFFDAGRLGIKKFELRKNDREYQVGDLFVSHEYSNEKCLEGSPFGTCHETEKGYTGRKYTGVITFVLKNYEGLQKGYCILGIEVLEK